MLVRVLWVFAPCIAVTFVLGQACSGYGCAAEKQKARTSGNALIQTKRAVALEQAKHVSLTEEGGIQQTTCHRACATSKNLWSKKCSWKKCRGCSDCSTSEKITPAPMQAYVEGRVINAEYPKHWYDSEDKARAACISDDDCKGYWKRTGGVYFILKSGSRTFEKGVPHSTVLSVKVKKNTLAPSSPRPSLPSSPQPAPRAIDEAYAEGRVINAEYPKHWYDSEEKARAECSSDDDCKGYWERTGGVYFILKSGSRTFEKGVPHSTVLSVKVKTDMLAPSSPPRSPAPFPQPMSQQTPQPAPRPTSATSPTRDTTTVAPEEWDYFLAFQESRRTGFSCPCGNLDWIECKGTEPGKHHHPPNSEKATFDCKLWVAAYRHADDQAIQGYFSHTGKDGRSPRQRAEDVGAKGGAEHQAGWHSTGPAALRGLQTSPGHCNSMFQRSFRGFAVGHGARRNDPRGDGDIWTVMYNHGGDDIADSESCIPKGYTATGDRK